MYTMSFTNNRCTLKLENGLCNMYAKLLPGWEVSFAKLIFLNYLYLHFFVIKGLHEVENCDDYAR